MDSIIDLDDGIDPTDDEDYKLIAKLLMGEELGLPADDLYSTYALRFETLEGYDDE